MIIPPLNIPFLSEEDNEAFCQKAERAVGRLFALARKMDEIDFAFALCPEMRGSQDAGWNTANEVFNVIDDFLKLIGGLEASTLKVRVGYALYAHLAEASGFYEVPMNMLRIAEGLPFIIWPFSDAVKYTEDGHAIAPNSNKVIKTLAGYSKRLGMWELAEVFRDAFCPRLRNAYAHADYVIWNDEIRLPNRNSGWSASISFEQFSLWLMRALDFFQILRHEIERNVLSYRKPLTFITARREKFVREWSISYNEGRGTFRIGTAPLTSPK